MADDDTFCFIDPSDALRSCHIIPAFARGLCHIGSSFVDRDMVMRYYFGLGVEHKYAHGQTDHSLNVVEATP